MYLVRHSSLNVVVPQVSGKLFSGGRAVLVLSLVSTGLKPFKLVDGPYKGLHIQTYRFLSYMLGNVDIDHRVALTHGPFNILRERISLFVMLAENPQSIIMDHVPSKRCALPTYCSRDEPVPQSQA